MNNHLIIFINHYKRLWLQNAPKNHLLFYPILSNETVKIHRPFIGRVLILFCLFAYYYAAALSKLITEWLLFTCIYLLLFWKKTLSFRFYDADHLLSVFSVYSHSTVLSFTWVLPIENTRHLGILYDNMFFVLFSLLWFLCVSLLFLWCFCSFVARSGLTAWRSPAENSSLLIFTSNAVFLLCCLGIVWLTSAKLLCFVLMFLVAWYIVSYPLVLNNGWGALFRYSPTLALGRYNIPGPYFLLIYFFLFFSVIYVVYKLAYVWSHVEIVHYSRTWSPAVAPSNYITDVWGYSPSYTRYKPVRSYDDIYYNSYTLLKYCVAHNFIIRDPWEKWEKKLRKRRRSGRS